MGRGYIRKLLKSLWRILENAKRISARKLSTWAWITEICEAVRRNRQCLRCGKIAAYEHLKVEFRS